MTTWGTANLLQIADLSEQFGIADVGEVRYVREQVGAERTGLTLYRMRPGRRDRFGHRHAAVEELYVCLSGSGRAKVDDELVELAPWDVLRVAPAAVRAFEAGPDGMDLLATGVHVPGDGEMLEDPWTAEADAPSTA